MLKLIIEGDSQIILDTIKKCSTPNWTLNSRLDEVLTLLDSFEDILIQHIYHEGNHKVDYLANKGVDSDFIYLVKNLVSSNV